MKLDELLAFLKKKDIQTWFDLGLFMDQFREEKEYPPIRFTGSYDDFKEHVRKGGIGFLTFHYMVDGVTVEVNKYASLMRRNIPGAPIHYIAGTIDSKTAPLINEEYQKHVIPEIAGFDEWELYRSFYFTKLERGSEPYNELIIQLWDKPLLSLKSWVDTSRSMGSICSIF